MLKLKFLISLVILLSVSNFSFGQKQMIKVDFDNISFDEFCTILSKQTGVQIYYPKQYFTALTVSMQHEQIQLIDAIYNAINSDSFQVVMWNKAILISKKDQIPDKLANYDFVNNTPTPEIVNAKEEKFIKTNKAGVKRKIVVGRKGIAKANSLETINVKVIDKQSVNAIPGATIYIEEVKKGAITTESGIAIVMLYPGKYTLRVMYMGMKTMTYQLQVFSSGDFDVYLEKQGINLSSVEIYGDRQMNMRKKDPGLEKVSIKVIKEIPVMVGEPDIVKASSMLPGIVSVSEGSAGLNVRGGGSDQNAFYLNDIPIFNTSHLFGFFPAFNADLIKDFTISKGFIPTKYGGKLSSVFDIETRKGNRQKFSLHGGISPMAVNVVMSVPIIKDTLSVIASARTSYSDWILRQINDPDINESSASFSDFSMGVYYDLPKLQLSVFGYHSKDYFAFSDINEYEYSNDGLSFSMGQNYSKKLRATYTLVAAQYKFSTRDYTSKTKAYEHPYSVMQNEFKTEFNYTINDHHQINAGYHLTYYDLNRGVVSPIENSIRTALDLGSEKGLENAIFISDQIQPLPWLDLNMGIRYGIYNPLGPKEVYKYTDDKYIDSQYIYDTLFYDNNEIISTYHFPELRFAANITASKKSNVKLSFTQMHQSLFMLNTTVSIAPSSQWKLADYYLKPSRSNQYSLGYFRSFTKYGFEASAEAYYKSTSDYTEFRDGADFLNSDKVEQSVLQGDQWAYGVEFMLRRRSSEYRFTGWIAYTYSRSFIQINGAETWQDINNGDIYPSSFDVPHAVNALLNIKLSKRLSFSTTVNYQSGRPITYPISIYYVDGMQFIDYSQRNAYRIPDYFRVDASFIIEGNLRRNKFAHSSFVLSVYNITGRDNPYSVFFMADNSGVSSYQYSIIAVPIITASWIFKLGNYDSN